MKYKCDDRIVIKIDEENVSDLNKGYGPKIYNYQVLGKLEDLTQAEEKIQMTIEEKAEFDDLYPDTFQDVSDFLNDIYNFPDNYPNLKKRLYSNDRTNNFHSQIEFVKALEKPSRIEVVKPEHEFKVWGFS